MHYPPLLSMCFHFLQVRWCLYCFIFLLQATRYICLRQSGEKDWGSFWCKLWNFWLPGTSWAYRCVSSVSQWYSCSAQHVVLPTVCTFFVCLFRFHANQYSVAFPEQRWKRWSWQHLKVTDLTAVPYSCLLQGLATVLVFKLGQCIRGWVGVGSWCNLGWLGGPWVFISHGIHFLQQKMMHLFDFSPTH